MHKLALLVLAGFFLAASSYQMLAVDSRADSNWASERHTLEITTRNAALSAFTEARHIVEAAGSVERFAPPGMRLSGDYEGAFYQTHIVSGGETISIHSAASMTNGGHTSDFSVSAEVAWATPVVGVGVRARPYLVLKAYREK